MRERKYILERAYLNVRFALVLDKRHGDGQYGISVRVTYDYKQLYIGTGERATEEEYERMIGKKKSVQERRERAEMVFDKVYAVSRELIDEGTFGKERLMWRMNIGKGGGVKGLIEEKARRLMEEEKPQTANTYRAMGKKLEQHFGDIGFGDLTADVVKRFRYLMEKEGLSLATQGIYLRNLRCICNEAISREMMTRGKYPFSGARHSGVKIPMGESRSERYLTTEEMSKLYRYKGEHEAEVGMFLVSYLSNGANLIDIGTLVYDEWYFKTRGQELRFVRSKTRNTTARRQEIYVPIVKPLRRLLEKYADKESEGCCLFPKILKGETRREKIMMRVGEYNRWIAKGVRVVCRELGLPDGVSITWARHSYKTNLIRSRVPDHFCEQMMGHSERDVGSYYVGAFTMEDRYRYNSLLIVEDDSVLDDE